MDVAFFTPLPPEQSGIADYSFELLEVLGDLTHVVTFVSDEYVADARAPGRIAVHSASEYDGRSFDCTVYQMGNNPRYHRFVYRAALNYPGLLVLHDPSLLDFHTEICGGTSGSIFCKEVEYDRPDLAKRELPRVYVGRGTFSLDRLEVLMARRLVEANRRTLVNSETMADLLSIRYPGSEVRAIKLPGSLRRGEFSPRATPWPGGALRFGVFGGINHYKRVLPTVEAFAELNRRFPGSEMVIAGRADDQALTKRCVELASGALRGALRVETDLTLEALEAEMSTCDVAIQLRWPTAGETSATLMRCFALGTPSIVSDVPQFREFDSRFCWRVPTEEVQERKSLLALMTSLVQDPIRTREAGRRARRFVEAEATYSSVAHAYLRHLEECRSSAPRRNSRHFPTRSGANLAVRDLARPELWTVAARLAAQLRAMGVDTALGAVSGDFASGRYDTSRDAVTDRRESALRDDWLARTHPYPVSIVVVDDDRPEEMQRWISAERRRHDRVIIGYYAPDAFPVGIEVAAVLEMCDEVWSPTAFAASAVQLHARREVLRFPLFDGGILGRPAGASEHGSPQNVLVILDGARSVVRDNPLESIRAYQQAFQQSERNVLVTLTVGLENLQAIPRDLELAVARVGGSVSRIRGESERRELIGSCDVLLSLHHADPYADRILLAVELGRRVISTDGFGTPEGLPASTVERVVSSTCDLREEDFHANPQEWRSYDSGQQWGEPDVTVAAHLLRSRVCKSPMGEIRRTESLVAMNEQLKSRALTRLDYLSAKTRAPMIPLRSGTRR